VLLLLLHLLLLAFNCLLFATIAPFRGHRSTFIVIIILYSFFLLSLLEGVFGGQKFLSFFRSLLNKTDRNTPRATTTRFDERDPRERGKVVSASLLFSFSRDTSFVCRNSQDRNEE